MMKLIAIALAHEISSVRSQVHQTSHEVCGAMPSQFAGKAQEE
jgi:hypothetical protein